MDSAFLTMTSLCPCGSVAGSSSIEWGTIVWCGVIKIKERDRVIRYNGPSNIQGAHNEKKDIIHQFLNYATVRACSGCPVNNSVNQRCIVFVQKNIYVRHYMIRDYIIILSIIRTKKIEFKPI